MGVRVSPRLLSRLAALLSVAVLLLLLLLFLSRPAAESFEKEVMSRWGPLAAFDLDQRLPLDEPLTAAQRAKVEQPSERLNGVLYFLVRPMAGNLRELSRGLQLLHRHFNGVARYPTMFFHDVDDERDRQAMQQQLLAVLGQLPAAAAESSAQEACSLAWQCRSINYTLDAYTGVDESDAPPLPWQSPLCSPLPVPPGLCLPWPVIFAHVRLDFPPLMAASMQAALQSDDSVEWDERCQPTRLGYRHMCRLMTFIQYHPLLAAFDWYWRLDDDSELLSPLPYDPFKVLHALHRSFGWVIADWEYDHCKAHLWEYVGQYRQRLLDEAGAVPGFDLLQTDDIIYFYNNFEIGRTSFWRRGEVRDFLAFIDQSQGTYRWRWGDAPIRTAALSLFMPRDQLFYLSEVHYRHEINTNFPESSVQKQLWRALLHSWLPQRWAFRLLSRLLIPLMLAIACWAMYSECRVVFAELAPSAAASVLPLASLDDADDEQLSPDSSDGDDAPHSPLLSHSLTSTPRLGLTPRVTPRASHALLDSESGDKSHSRMAAELEHGREHFVPSSSHSQRRLAADWPSPAPSMQAGRVASVDYLKCVSLLTVVFIHCIADSGYEKRHGWLEYAMHDVTRFAVPGLLFVSGFLVDKQGPAAQQRKTEAALLSKYALRLLPPYMTASLAAFVFFSLLGKAPFGLLELPSALLLGYTVEVYYFVFVICYLALLSLLLRRVPVVWVHALLLPALAALLLIYFFPSSTIFIMLRHPAVYLFPYLLGWIVGYHYKRAGEAASSQPATAEGRGASLFAARPSTSSSFPFNGPRRSFVLDVTEFIERLLSCRRSVVSFCLLFSLSSLLYVQDPLRLEGWQRNTPLQAHVYAVIVGVMCWTSGSQVAAPPGWLVWLNDSSYPFFLYHLVFVRLVDDLFELLLPFPFYCPPLWMTSVGLAMGLVRLLQWLLGPASSLVLGCPSPDREAALHKLYRRLSQSRVTLRCVSVLLCCCVSVALLCLAAASLVRSFGSHGRSTDWTGSILSPADLALTAHCESSTHRPTLRPNESNADNPFGLEADSLALVQHAVTVALQEWEGATNGSAPSGLLGPTELLSRPQLMRYLREWYSFEVSFVQVRRGVIRLWTHNEFHLRSSPFGVLANHRRRSFLDMLHSLTSLYGASFPDVEFVLSTLDAPVEYLSADPAAFWGFDHGQFFVQGRSPAFSVVHCSNSATIVVPMHDDRLGSYADWDETACRIRASRARFPPLAERRKRAVLRGGVRACHLNASDVGTHSYTDKQFMFSGPEWRQCGRSGLAWQALQLDHKPYLFDIQLSTNIDELQQLMAQHAPPDSPANLQLIAHQQSVAVIYAHGQCHWANRLEELLWMSSVVLLQAGQCQQYYALGLQPWVHYVPVDYNFHNISAAVEWVLLNMDEAARMVERMNHYAQSISTYASTLTYVDQLLRRYSRMQPQPLAPLTVESMAQYSDSGMVVEYPDRYVCSPDSTFWCEPWAQH